MPLLEHPPSPLVGKLHGVHLFHFEGAPCAQRVRFALAEKGLARGKEVPWRSDAPDGLTAQPGTWTSRHVSLVRKEHLSEEYAAIHPNLVVPALVHDGRLHVESMDIVQYLDDTWPRHPLLPKDARAEEVRRLVELGKALHVSVRYVSFRWGLGRLGRLDARSEDRLRRLEPEGSPERMVHFYERYDRGTIDAATYARHLSDLEAAYASLERVLGGDERPFLVGPELTMADIIWSLTVLRLTECGYPFARKFPALHAWYRRIERRPAFQRGVMERHVWTSRAFRLKSSFANLVGLGLARAATGSTPPQP